MANKKTPVNQRGTSPRQNNQQRAGRENEDLRGRGRSNEDYNNDSDWYAWDRYDREQQDYRTAPRENRQAGYGDDFGYPNRNYDWRHEEDQYNQGGRQEENRRSGFYPGGVGGNRNESRGEGYGGYGRQENGWNYREDRFNEDDRFYNDRGYSRDMYSSNDRSGRRDNDRRYSNERYNYGGYDSGRYAGNNRNEHDRRMSRDEYENMHRDRNQFSRDYNRGNEFDSRQAFDRSHEGRQQAPWHDGSNGNQRKQRVVGRGMYGNNPSGRYGSYGDDTMHGNMGGGTWQGNNEYQVGGGVGYQQSDAGTYGSFSGETGEWKEDQAPGRKYAATKGGRRISQKNKEVKDIKNTNRQQANRAVTKKSTGNKKDKI